VAGHGGLALMARTNFNTLSETDLLKIFDSDPGIAEAKYMELCQKLQRFFEWRHIADPSDLVQEAIARGLSNLQAGKQITSADPAHYFFGIAHNLVKEKWKSRKQEQLEEEDVPSKKSAFMGLEGVEQGIYLQQCIKELTQEDFDLLLAYTEGSAAEWGLARGLQPGAVRLRVFRLRRRIEERVRSRIAMAARKS
jgi:DNA-directed RNA polymerase specialized sigma24 family protein